MMVRSYNGQKYLALETVPYLRQDGEVTELIRWSSRCAQCGELFVFTAPARSTNFQPNRRCHKHKRPGCRVRGGA